MGKLLTFCIMVFFGISVFELAEHVNGAVDPKEQLIKELKSEDPETQVMAANRLQEALNEVDWCLSTPKYYYASGTVCEALQALLDERIVVDTILNFNLTFEDTRRTEEFNTELWAMLMPYMISNINHKDRDHLKSYKQYLDFNAYCVRVWRAGLRNNICMDFFSLERAIHFSRDMEYNYGT